MTKDFVIVMVSANTNAFGLARHHLVASDGTYYTVERSIYTGNPWLQGQVIRVPISNGRLDWTSFGETLINFRNAVPQNIVNLAFGGKIAA